MIYKDLVEWLNSNKQRKNDFELFIQEHDYEEKYEIDGHTFTHIFETEMLRDGTFDIIFQVDDGPLYRILAHYDSWSGADYDNYSFTQVKPVTKTHIDYEDVYE